MFIVVRNTKSTPNNQDYQLCKGDIIKLGRIKFNVKSFFGIKNSSRADSPMKAVLNRNFVDLESDGEVSEGLAIEDGLQAVDDTDNDAKSLQNTSRSHCSQQSKSQKQCKVCWSNDHTTENPLINSCQCDGSVRFIHFMCLKQWLSQKLTRKEIESAHGEIISYSWKQFECEICKVPYPYTYKLSGKKYRLID